MAPKPRPLHEVEIVIDNDYGSNEGPTRAGNPNQTGGFSLEQQENVEPSRQQDNGQNENVQSTGPIIHSPKRTTPWLMLQQQQRETAGRIIARKSLSPSNLYACANYDPPETRENTSSNTGIMMREGDFLDRTFDNVENVTCDRTSIAKAPPAPIFSCNAPGNGSNLETEQAIDIAALSSAKQIGYNIEQFDGHDSGDQEMQPSSSGSDPDRPPLVPVNSILEEQQFGVAPSELANTKRSVAPPKRDMLDFIFENVHTMICREDHSSAIQLEDSQQIELQLRQPHWEEQQHAVDGGSDEGEPSSLNLHQTLPNSKTEGLIDGCNSIFTNGEMSSAVHSETSSKTASYRRDPFAPIRYEDGTPSTHDSKPRTGMMLLADGSIVVPEGYSNRWVQHQQRKVSSYGNAGMPTPSSNHPSSRSGSSIHTNRESSLLDMVSRSADASEEDAARLTPLRSQKRVRTDGGSETIIIPRRGYDEEDARGVGTEVKGTVSAEDMERQHFWMQVAFAATILLLACALIVFAFSFFWPTHKMT